MSALQPGSPAWRRHAEEERQQALTEPDSEVRRQLLDLWAQTYGRVGAAYRAAHIESAPVLDYKLTGADG